MPSTVVIQLTRGLRTILAGALLSVFPALLCAQSLPKEPPEQVPILRGPPSKDQRPAPDPVEFLDRERAKLLDKLYREGPQVDLQRELQKLADRHRKDFGTEVDPREIDALWAELEEHQSRLPLDGPWLAAPPKPPPGEKGPKRPAEEFVAHELQKLAEKREREGERFDGERELSKLQERYAKDYGTPLSDSDLRTFVTFLSDAPAGPFQIPSGLPANLPSTSGATAPRGDAWRTLAERDQDGDGQIGFYEWPRTERDRFYELDANGDGFLTEPESGDPGRSTASR